MSQQELKTYTDKLPQLPSGTRVTGAQGVYVIERFLGLGLTAQVYLAHRESDQQPVALKVLRADASQTSTDNFWQEYWILDALHRAGVAAAPQVLDQQKTGGLRFLALEYVDHSIYRPLDQQIVSEAEALEITRQTLALLDTLHTQVERTYTDMQLQNFLWQAETQTLRVIDWNHVSAPKKYIQEKELQHFGVKDFTELAQCDLVKWGTFLYQLLTGKAASPQGEPRGLLARRAGGRWEGLSAATRQLLVRALHPDPAQRYASAAAFLQAVEAVQALWCAPIDSDAARKEYSDLRKAAMSAETAARLERLWVTLDMLERRGEADATLLNYKKQVLDKWLTPGDTGVWSSGKDYYTHGHYADAIRKWEPEVTAQGRSALYRWLALAETGNVHSHNFAAAKEDLEKLVALLSEEPGRETYAGKAVDWLAAQQQWADILTAHPWVKTAPIGVLGREVAVAGQIAAAREAEAVRQWAQAVTAYETAERGLEQIAHAACLREEYGWLALPEWIAAATAKRDALAQADAQAQDLRAVFARSAEEGLARLRLRFQGLPENDRLAQFCLNYAGEREIAPALALSVVEIALLWGQTPALREALEAKRDELRQTVLAQREQKEAEEQRTRLAKEFGELKSQIETAVLGSKWEDLRTVAARFAQEPALREQGRYIDLVDLLQAQYDEFLRQDNCAFAAPLRDALRDLAPEGAAEREAAWNEARGRQLKGQIETAVKESDRGQLLAAAQKLATLPHPADYDALVLDLNQRYQALLQGHQFVREVETVSALIEKDAIASSEGSEVKVTISSEESDAVESGSAADVASVDMGAPASGEAAANAVALPAVLNLAAEDLREALHYLDPAGDGERKDAWDKQMAEFNRKTAEDQKASKQAEADLQTKRAALAAIETEEQAKRKTASEKTQQLLEFQQWAREQVAAWQALEQVAAPDYDSLQTQAELALRVTQDTYAALTQEQIVIQWTEYVQKRQAAWQAAADAQAARQQQLDEQEQQLNEAESKLNATLTQIGQLTGESLEQAQQSLQGAQKILSSYTPQAQTATQSQSAQPSAEEPSPPTASEMAADTGAANSEIDASAPREGNPSNLVGWLPEHQVRQRELTARAALLQELLTHAEQVVLPATEDLRTQVAAFESTLKLSENGPASADMLLATFSAGPTAQRLARAEYWQTRLGTSDPVFPALDKLVEKVTGWREVLFPFSAAPETLPSSGAGSVSLTAESVQAIVNQIPSPAITITDDVVTKIAEAVTTKLRTLSLGERVKGWWSQPPYGLRWAFGALCVLIVISIAAIFWQPWKFMASPTPTATPTRTATAPSATTENDTPSPSVTLLPSAAPITPSLEPTDESSPVPTTETPEPTVTPPPTATPTPLPTPVATSLPVSPALSADFALDWTSGLTVMSPITITAPADWQLLLAQNAAATVSDLIAKGPLDMLWIMGVSVTDALSNPVSMTGTWTLSETFVLWQPLTPTLPAGDYRVVVSAGGLQASEPVTVTVAPYYELAIVRGEPISPPEPGMVAVYTITNTGNITDTVWFSFYPVKPSPPLGLTAMITLTGSSEIGVATLITSTELTTTLHFADHMTGTVPITVNLGNDENPLNWYWTIALPPLAPQTGLEMKIFVVGDGGMPHSWFVWIPQAGQGEPQAQEEKFK